MVKALFLIAMVHGCPICFYIHQIDKNQERYNIVLLLDLPGVWGCQELRNVISIWDKQVNLLKAAAIIIHFHIQEDSILGL